METKELLNKMTTEEKIGQLIQLSADFFSHNKAEITGPIKNSKLSLSDVYKAGSVLGISGAKQIREIQNDYLNHSRLKIPLMFMADIVHGYKSIFPIPLALGATFNPDLVEETARVAAKEAAVSGLSVAFAPMVDLVRDPRWGRVMESTGEDPYLNSLMAESTVKGFQGENQGKIDNDHVAACVKHFAAYGAPEAGREYNTVDISEWRFREQYLLAYKRAIKANAKLVMTSFNTLFGVPATANQYLMRDVLRKELDFNGVLISDWDAIGELINHGTASDLQDAAKKALKCGVDIDMMSYAYFTFLRKASKLDENILKLIDESALRILELKESLGLFEDPYRGISTQREDLEILNKKNLLIAQKAAEESIVLLKNKDKILPMGEKTRLAVIGPTANTGNLLGSWSWKGDENKTETIYHAVLTEYPSAQYSHGCGYRELNYRELSNAKKLAKNSDVILLCLGLPACESGEATSLTNIKLPKEQLVLLKELAELNKPIVSVIVTGRPLDLTDVEEVSDGIILTWFPGSSGAKALTNILIGNVSPNGKLSMTFPRNVGQIPIYYNQYNTGRPINHDEKDNENKYLSKYIDESNDPLYPFGYGLSYADFRIKQVNFSSNVLMPNHPVKLTVTVENKSKIDAKTVIQLYFHQKVGATVHPIKQLFKFKKQMIKANSTEIIEFMIDVKDFASVHPNMSTYTDNGLYEIGLGLDSNNINKYQIEVRNENYDNNKE
jgi:beta-glucosidase